MTDIFVFGSNLAGIHGAGSAKEAVDKHGAEYDVGVGPWGNSYAIPTKDCMLDVLELSVIELYVKQFITYAEEHPDLTFNVVAIGCGLAGYKPHEIAPFFEWAPENVNLPEVFVEYFTGALLQESSFEEVIEGKTDTGVLQSVQEAS